MIATITLKQLCEKKGIDHSKHSIHLTEPRYEINEGVLKVGCWDCGKWYLILSPNDLLEIDECKRCRNNAYAHTGIEICGVEGCGMLAGHHTNHFQEHDFVPKTHRILRVLRLIERCECSVSKELHEEDGGWKMAGIPICKQYTPEMVVEVEGDII